MWHVGAFAISFIVCFAAIMTIGGAAERISVIAQGSAYCATLASTGLVMDQSYHGVMADFWLVDSALLLVLLFLSLVTTRFWILWVAAIQLLSVLAHLIRAVDAQMLPAGYYAVVALSAWPMIGLTLIGAIRHHQRRARFGTDPSFMIYWCQLTRCAQGSGAQRCSPSTDRSLQPSGAGSAGRYAR